MESHQLMFYMLQVQFLQRGSTITTVQLTDMASTAVLEWQYMKFTLDTHHPVLNSTCASNKATTGAKATLQPLTLDLISPSCLLWWTTLMNPVPCWELVSSTNLCRCSLSSPAKNATSTNTHGHSLHTWSYWQTSLLWIFTMTVGVQSAKYILGQNFITQCQRLLWRIFLHYNLLFLLF